MTTFTKEQLIAEARGNLEALKGFEARHPGGDLLLLNIRLAEIALASLEAGQEVQDDGRDQFEEWFKFHHSEDGSIVTLRRANGGANYCDPHVDLAWIAWKDSRAAMQGKAEPVNQPYKLPEDYCVMPLRLTAENGAKGALSGEFHVTLQNTCQSCGGEGCEDCNEEGSWESEIPIGWDTIKRIHEAAVEACALPEAPQQEVKP
ncbi:TPA: hypothetical protein HLU11_13155 [Escherichia coli]|nr:hypothetical protein [Escherichia coli]HCJ8722703.1 hypothetical protein [Escherichia coli]